MNQAFWNGKRVLLTGHTGFKGAWLACWLEQLGATVCGFALAPDQAPAMFDEIAGRLSLQHVIGDLRDLASVEDVVRRADPEIVLHLGAQALVRRSYRDPVETFATNVLGTVHLLDALRRLARPAAIVVVTSDKCYENREWLWPYRETEPMGGHDPYSSSKGCTELAVASFRRSYFADRGIGLASARAGNVIGGGDWSEDRLVPDLVRAFHAGSPAPIRSPRAIRPWQHVLDALSGYLLLAEKLHGEPARYADGWNFGPLDADVTTVEVLADLMTEAWGDGAKWELGRDASLHEAHLLKLDSSKARAELSWRPRLRLAEAAALTAAWYKAAAGRTGAADATHDQIARYSTMEWA